MGRTPGSRLSYITLPRPPRLPLSPLSATFEPQPEPQTSNLKPDPHPATSRRSPWPPAAAPPARKGGTWNLLPTVARARPPRKAGPSEASLPPPPKQRPPPCREGAEGAGGTEGGEEHGQAGEGMWGRGVAGGGRRGARGLARAGGAAEVGAWVAERSRGGPRAAEVAEVVGALARAAKELAGEIAADRLPRGGPEGAEGGGSTRPGTCRRR